MCRVGAAAPVDPPSEYQQELLHLRQLLFFG